MLPDARLSLLKKNSMIKCTNDEMLEKLNEFAELYSWRPIKDNDGGMKSAHMFPSWFIIQRLKPVTIIESGVWKGLGTWFFRNACPSARIISIDPEPKFREHTDPTATYQTEDFLTTDWSNIEKDSTLVFFDDHQNCMPRLKKCLDIGFNRVIIEDNYPYQQGDCYSPKKILADKNFVIDAYGFRRWYNKNPQDLQFLEDHVSTYQEMPPIFTDEETRWGDVWDDSYPTPNPLLSYDSRDKYPLFYKERFDYTWICYLELTQ
jgi:hypothetical protein